jgi:hypothetical protein
LFRAAAEKASQRFEPGRVAHLAEGGLVGQRTRKSQGSFRCLNIFNHLAFPMRCERGQGLPDPKEQTQTEENNKHQDKSSVDDP